MRLLGKSTEGQGEVVRIRDGWRVQSAAGAETCVLITDCVDITSLDESRYRRVLGAFNEICHSIDTPLSVVVQLRRVSSRAQRGAHQHSHGPTAIALDQAVAAHTHERLAAQPAFDQRILLSPTVHNSAPNALSKQCDRLLHILRSGGLGGRLLEGEELGLLVDEASGQWYQTPHIANHGGIARQALLLCRLPGGAVLPGWLAPVLKVNVECDIALHFSPVDRRQAMGVLHRRLRDHGSRQLISAERGGLGDPSADVAVDSALSLRAALANHQSRPLGLAVSAVARGTTEDRARAATEALGHAFGSMLAVTEPALFRQRQTALSTLPLGQPSTATQKLVSADAAASCIPWLSSRIDDIGGYHLGFAHHGGAPVSLNPFSTEHYSNANIGVFAASGQGKSFTVNGILLEGARHGIGAVVVDPEGEYRPVIQHLGGAYVALQPRSAVALNVLDVEWRHGDVDAVVQTAISFVDLLCGGQLTHVDHAHLDSTIRSLILSRPAHTATTLSDCIAPLASVLPAVSKVVERLCNGPYGPLFNGPTRLELNHPFCGLGLRDLPDDLVAPATLLIADWLWNLVCHDPQPRHVVFDEVGALSGHASLRRLLVQLARRCRKYGASLVVATQNVQDLLRTDDGMVVASNCSIVLLGGHRALETSRMEAAFGLTPRQRQELETAPRGRFLLLAGHRRLEVDIDLPPLYRAVIEGRC